MKKKLLIFTLVMTLITAFSMISLADNSFDGYVNSTYISTDSFIEQEDFNPISFGSNNIQSNAMNVTFAYPTNGFSVKTLIGVAGFEDAVDWWKVDFDIPEGQSGIAKMSLKRNLELMVSLYDHDNNLIATRISNTDYIFDLDVTNNNYYYVKVEREGYGINKLPYVISFDLNY